MGLLDGVFGALGGQSAVTSDIEGLVGHFGGTGLESIVTQFERGGLGNVVQSWVASGANLPVSADQLHAVLGSDMVTRLSQSLGIDPSHLAEALPQVINHLTPNGQIPSGGLDSAAIGNILSGFLKPNA